MYYTKILKLKDKIEIKKIELFLEKNNLDMGSFIEYFVEILDNASDNIIACGAISKGGVIKCVAIDENYRGEGIALKLITEIINLSFEIGYRNLFLFTKPENEQLFKNCSFYTIEKATHAILMEDSSTNFKKYLSNLSLSIKEGNNGAIVINANPFTKGHQYIIEKASQMCDNLYVFVVEENASYFCFEDRYYLVEKGISELNKSNIILNKGGKYIISRATFPSYFIKDKVIVDDTFFELDLKIFRNHIAPALGIKRRFVGSEPFCELTNRYNQSMQKWFTENSLNSPKLELIVIDRKKINDIEVSASMVRNYFLDGNISKIKDFLPKETFDFLSKKII